MTFTSLYVVLDPGGGVTSIFPKVTFGQGAFVLHSISTTDGEAEHIHVSMGAEIMFSNDKDSLVEPEEVPVKL